MEWLSNLTSGENGSAVNLVLITLALAILLIVVVWIFRKMTGSAARRAMRSRVPRLSITDSTTVDEKRYLVMVRRDNVEHLLLIGGANDLVVESNIVRAQTSQKTTPTSTVRKTEIEQPSAADQVPLEEQTSITAPIASAAAVGSVGLASVSAAASTTASEVVETTTDVVSDAVDTITESAGDLNDAAASSITEATSVVGETTSDIMEQGSEAVEAVVETVSAELEVEPEIEMTPEPAETVEVAEFIEPPVQITEQDAVEVEVPEIDLESTISAQLDDALSGDALEFNSAGLSDVVPETPTANDVAELPNTDGDDEMQRLLDELSSEAKEPAQ